MTTSTHHAYQSPRPVTSYTLGRTGPEPCECHFRSISASVDNGMIVIGVADQGVGIPPDATETIFDKFARVQFEDSQPPGTGLGLAICRGFLQAMGGTISASNRNDRSGALFSIRLAISNM